MIQPRKKPAEKRRERQEASAQTQERRAPVSGRTPGQKKYLQAIKTSEVVIAYGPAGTGKTFLPSAYAAELMMVGEIDKIILCRPVVEAGGEKIGYLPGDADEKLEPWTLPIMDVLELKLGRGIVQKKRDEGKIIVVPFGYMRGRTFDKAFVLADEMQNATPEMARLLMGRLGEGVRMVVSGDLKQCDLRTPKNGLEVLISITAAREMPGVTLVQLGKEDIVRSAQCQQWVEAFEQYDGNP